MSSIQQGEYPAAVVKYHNYRMTVTLKWGDEGTMVRVGRNLANDLGPDLIRAAWEARDKHAARYDHGPDFLPRAGTVAVVGHIADHGTYTVTFVPAWAVAA